ncbi:MAG: Lpg1974 family pore-forming outer membrane protein, partial [Planctomycetales bacterium]
MTRFIGYILSVVLCLVACRASAGGISPFAEVLAWRPSEETSTTWASVLSESDTSGRIFDAPGLDFDFSPGMRFGFSFQPDDSDWDAKIYWTYLPATSSASVPMASHIVIPEFFSGFLSEELFDCAAIGWALDYNTIDFELGYEIPLTEFVAIRPWTGLKAAIINQSMHVAYTGIFPTQATEKVSHDYWGIGLNFGVDGRWDLPTNHP